MKYRIPAVLSVLLASVFLSACGSTGVDVYLTFVEDGTYPCLGASHMKFEVLYAGDTKLYHEFGLFFSPEEHNDFQCEMPDLTFAGLPYGENVQFAVTLSDSTSEDKGVICAGTSATFSATSGSGDQEVRIDLSRNPAVEVGTVLLWEPDDWPSAAGIHRLQFRVSEHGQVIPERAWFFDYDPALRPHPFPLVITNLPVTQENMLWEVVVEGLDESPQVIRKWTGQFLLVEGEVGYVNLEEG